jgi:hypothetical protein
MTNPETNDGSICRICGSKWMRKYGGAICEGGHHRGIPMVNDGDRYCICGLPFLRGDVCAGGHPRGPIEPHRAGPGCLGCWGVMAGIAFLLIAIATSGYQLSSWQVPPELLVGGLVIAIIIGALKVFSIHPIDGIEEGDYPFVWRE